MSYLAQYPSMVSPSFNLRIKVSARRTTSFQPQLVFYNLQEGTFHLVLNTGAALLTIARRRVKEIDDLCKKYKLTITNGDQVRKRGKPAKKQDQLRVTPALR